MIELEAERLARGNARYSLRNSAEWKEEDHPRAEDGKFGTGGSSKEKKETKAKKIIQTSVPPTMKKYGIDGNKPAILYHGTKRQYDTIDLSKTGTSSGTTEGWGAYLSSSKPNAKRFGPNIHQIKLMPEDMEKFLDMHASMNEQTEYVKNKLKPLIDRYSFHDDKMIVHLTRSFFRNPVNISNFRKESWFEILKSTAMTNDANKIKDTIKSIKNENIKRFLYSKLVGSENIGSYQLYSKLSADWGSDKLASEALNGYGIMGLVMPSSADMYSVTDGANFVIFDQNFLDSEKNNSIKVYRASH